MQSAFGEVRERFPSPAGLFAKPHVPGFYLRRRGDGFVAYLCASAGALRAVRGVAASVLGDSGVAPEVAETVQLVLSELMGNAVRACGDHAPLVVEVYPTPAGVAVNVHDPDPCALPRRSATALDSLESESGRGLGMLDLLAPGWRTRRSAIGKQIRCRVPAGCAVP